MRTGGDDIAQALALMGVRPTWDNGSGRVSGFEILPLSILDRPRVDVTCGCPVFSVMPSGADRPGRQRRPRRRRADEPAELNPMSARVRRDVAAMTAAGLPVEAAQKRAGFRVFGSSGRLWRRPASAHR